MFQMSDPHGLHARPAALFVRTVRQFQADITVQCRDISIDGKSLMALLTLGVEHGDIFAVIAEGTDAACTMQALDTLLLHQPMMRSVSDDASAVTLDANGKSCKAGQFLEDLSLCIEHEDFVCAQLKEKTWQRLGEPSELCAAQT